MAERPTSARELQDMQGMRASPLGVKLLVRMGYRYRRCGETLYNTIPDSAHQPGLYML